jgi:CCR4-NOT transcriptional regulation complex NOT5 subunit
MLDFGGMFARDFQSKVKYYKDLSASGDYLEAIGSIYDDLRWAETK